MEPTRIFFFNKEIRKIASPSSQKMRIENFAFLLLPGCPIELQKEFRLVLVQGRFSIKMIIELEQLLYLVLKTLY